MPDGAGGTSDPLAGIMWALLVRGRAVPYRGSLGRE